MVVACGGSSDDDATSASSTTSDSSTTTVTTPATTARETTTTKAAGEADVDLDFKGTYVLQVHGQYGECKVVNGMFGFSMTGDDVPGIGDGFSVAQLGLSNGEIKWVIDDINAYDSSATATLTFSSDGKSVEIDDDLSQRNAQDGAPPRPEHVTGTITCP